MIRKKKWKSDFALSRAATSSAHVIETQLPVGHPINFPKFDGMYSILVDQEERKSLGVNPFLVLSRQVDGFVESTGTKRVDLTSSRVKIIKTISSSVFHFFADDVCDILYALRLYPDAEVIIDVSMVSTMLDEPSRSFLGFFFDALEDQGIRHKLVDVSKFDIVYINNYIVAESAYRSSLSGTLIYEFFKKYVDNPKTEPYRNVYLTRSKVQKDVSKLSEQASRLSFTTDDRVDSEDELNKKFLEMGFEVVAPEDFKDFHEQINYFYSVKTIASLTSSGLANALFMQPGGTVIEISTPLVVISPMLSAEKTVIDIDSLDGSDPTMAQELHMFYKLVAYLKDHTYLSINNPGRRAEDIKKYIDVNAKLAEFLDNNDKSNNL
jgi:predicted ATPase